MKNYGADLYEDYEYSKKLLGIVIVCLETNYIRT